MSQKRVRLNSAPLQPDPLGAHTILVKHFFTNRAMVPEGVPWKDRASHEEMDEYHTKWLEFQIAHPGLTDEDRYRTLMEKFRSTWIETFGEIDVKEQARKGRFRKNRRDTGQPVYRSLPRVNTPELRRALANNGFYLTKSFHAHTQKPQSESTTPKHVVTLAYEYYPGIVPREIPRLPKDVHDGLRVLSKMTWGIAHVWLNPDGKITANLLQLERDAKPRYQLTVRGGHLLRVA